MIFAPTLKAAPRSREPVRTTFAHAVNGVRHVRGKNDHRLDDTRAKRDCGNNRQRGQEIAHATRDVRERQERENDRGRVGDDRPEDALRAFDRGFLRIATTLGTLHDDVGNDDRIVGKHADNDE